MPVDPNVDIVARTIAGEARGCGLLDWLAVGAVIRERVLRPGWWGTDWQSVCRKSSQFSCWNQGDPNRTIILEAEARLDPALWRSIYHTAEFVVHHMRDEDLYALFNTKGPFPCHYHARGIQWPGWTLKAKVVHVPWDSAHIFYTGVEGTPRRRAA